MICSIKFARSGSVHCACANLGLCTFIETFFLEVRKGVELCQSGEVFRCSLVTLTRWLRVETGGTCRTDRSYCVYAEHVRLGRQAMFSTTLIC